MEYFTIIAENSVNNEIDTLECDNKEHCEQMLWKVIKHYAELPQFVDVAHNYSPDSDDIKEITTIYMANGTVTLSVHKGQYAPVE